MDEKRARACNKYTQVLMGGGDGKNNVRFSARIGGICVCSAKGTNTGEDIFMSFGILERKQEGGVNSMV